MMKKQIRLLIRKIKTFFTNPRTLVRKMLKLKLTKKLSDKTYLKIFYWAYRGEKLNIENPKKYSEKLQWLKIHDKNPTYTKLVDKYEVKDIIKEKIGSQYIIPTLGVWDDFDDINFEELPNQFVLKCTHDSGGIVICKNKEELDIKKAKKKLKKHLSYNFYYFGREWPYKNVKPRIIAEKYMKDESEEELIDYKIFCFHGEPKFIQVDIRIFSNNRRNIYDIKWNLQDVKVEYECELKKEIQKPKKLDEMLYIARTLSKDIPHVRVDLYLVNNQIYFGELTFYSGSGITKRGTTEDEIEIGKLINLAKVKERLTINCQ